MTSDPKPLPPASGGKYILADEGSAERAYPAVIIGEYVRIIVDCAEDFGDPKPIAEKIVAALNATMTDQPTPSPDDVLRSAGVRSATTAELLDRLAGADGEWPATSPEPCVHGISPWEKCGLCGIGFGAASPEPKKEER